MSDKKPPRKKHLRIKPLTERELAQASGSIRYSCPGDCGKLVVIISDKQADGLLVLA